MPKIEIKEKDLTSPGSLQVSTNTVYVPGFTTKGPENQPTLVETVAQLEELFYDKDKGYVTYYISDDEVCEDAISAAVTNKPTVTKPYENISEIANVTKHGDAERGYIFAKMLLNEGIPVIFERLALPTGADAERTYNKLITDKSTDAQGNTTVSYKTKEEKVPAFAITVTQAYTQLASLSAEDLKDKGSYNIKFITSGGYPVLGESFKVMKAKEAKADNFIGSSIASTLTSIATARGDCVALLDHVPDIEPNALFDKMFAETAYYNLKKDSTTEYEKVTVKDEKSDTWVYKTTGAASGLVAGDNGKYVALFSPWGTYNLPSNMYQRIVTNTDSTVTVSSTYTMPGSFAYLMALAVSVRTNPNWYAVAGAQRGAIPYLLDTYKRITNAIADDYQKRDTYSINPITRINPFGLILWGNRTAYNNGIKGNLTASSFLNVRNLISDVKKTVWTAARQMTFEQNNEILWVVFKSLITPTLDQMVSGNGLRSYELKRRVAFEKATLSAVVRLFAIEAIEDFEIEIQLADDSTVVTE